MSYFCEETGFNLDTYSFAEWVQFVFDHPAEEAGWNWRLEWEHYGTPEHILPYITRLCKHPEFLLQTYSTEQIEHGFWYLPIGGKVEDWIWNSRIAWRLRKKCIYAMVDLYRKLFAARTWDTIDNMWWGMICKHNWQKPQAKVKNAMADALTQVIKIDNAACQKAALHGLGHLSHPRGRTIIRQFLAAHPDIDSEMKNYALRAADGRVM